MIQNFKKQLGFTLIELMVVITVIAVLAGVVLINVDPLGQADKQNDVKRKADLVKIQSMLERYYIKEGAYPDPNPAGKITCDATLVSTDGSITFGVIPCAPNNDGSNYFYTVSPGNDAYCLRACFVNASDSARDQKNPAYCSGAGCNNPSPAQMGSTCSILDDCAARRRSYSVLSP